MNQYIGRQIYDREDYLKFFPEDYQLCMQDFYDACPYTIDQLRSPSRKEDLKSWRNVGMFYQWMLNNNFMYTGIIFNRNHSTVIHGVKMVVDAMDGYNYILKEKVDAVINSNTYGIYATDDIHTNEVLALILLENESLERFRK
jgi:hypothetical protein